MSRINIIDLPLSGLKLIERNQHTDSRGFLSRLFCSDELRLAGWVKPIAQINHSYTAQRGTVRGMHFQHAPKSEMKLVTCIKGEIWDVAVDLRANSPTFLHWHAEFLSNINQKALLIPEGFAHGFQSITDQVELIYLHTEKYHNEFEDGLNVKDPSLNIQWPQPIVQLSSKDADRPLINHTFKGVQL